jgi:flagellar capping protein FliD
MLLVPSVFVPQTSSVHAAALSAAGVAVSSFVGAYNAWVTSLSQSLGMNSTGWSGFNMRQLIPASALSTSGSKVRLTLTSSTAGGCSVDGAYIGHAAGSGDPYDFDGTQVAVTVGSSASFSISANSSVVTDEIVYALDETKNLVLAVHFNTTSAIRGQDSLIGFTNYFKSAANETSVSNVGSYSLSTAALRMVEKIEVWV